MQIFTDFNCRFVAIYRKKWYAKDAEAMMFYKVLAILDFAKQTNECNIYGK